MVETDTTSAAAPMPESAQQGMRGYWPGRILKTRSNGGTCEMTRALPIDPAEVAWHIERLAHFGAHGATGVWRTVYSPEWTAAQHQLAEWFQAAGLSVRQDAVGNLWGRLEGSAGGGVI